MRTRELMHLRAGPGGQRGVATLMLTLVVLVGLTMVTFYAAHTGLMNQRIASNEVRAREAHQAAEAGIEAAIAFLADNKTQIGSTGTGGWVEAGSERWVLCTNSDVGFPCGDGTTNQYGDDSMSLRYAVGGTTTIADISDYLSDHATPQMGDQPVEVYLLARCADEVNNTTGAGVPDDVCDDLNSGASGIQGRPSTSDDSAFLVVAQGWSADQTGTATIQQGLVLYQIPNSAPDSPLTVKGNAQISGGFEIVANPNGGGPGVPLSVWSDDDVGIGAAAATCHLGEYLETVGNASLTVINYDDGTTVKFCDTCLCSSAAATGALSNNSDGEQEDFLDVDSNLGVNPDATNFPTDVFQYTFGTPSANWREIQDQAHKPPPTDCNSMGPTSSGLYWVIGDCVLPSNTEIGSPKYPVLIVVDDALLRVNANTVVYGLLYSFDNPDHLPAGADVDVVLNGGPVVNGAIMIDHDVDLSAGNFVIRYEAKVLETLFDMSGGRGLGKRPGTWLDYVDYTP